MVGGSIHDRLVRAARAEAQALRVNLRGRLPPNRAGASCGNPTGAEPHVSLAVEETENMPPPVPNPGAPPLRPPLSGPPAQTTRATNILWFTDLWWFFSSGAEPIISVG
ncbi:hypothetical protein N7453_008284 [Penicillium expansum]|nr:hypothetical protein N7453_008284 [Penicillium expansum]